MMGCRSLGWIGAGCLLLPCWLGCVSPLDRHGVILRGDWSVELNRVPWLGCPRPACRECGESECAAGPEASPAAAASPLPPCRVPDVPDPPPARPPAGPPNGANAGPLSCLFGWVSPAGCQQGGSCGRRAGGWAGAEEHIHSRFHPVPSQPAFYPRSGQFQPIPGGPFPQYPPQAQLSQMSAQPRTLPPPQPIRVHAPEPPDDAPAAPVPPGDRETQSHRRLGRAGRGPSLIFSPAPDQLAGTPAGGREFLR